MRDTWICGTAFVGREDMYVRDGLHLSSKRAAVLPRDCQGWSPADWVKYDI